MLESLKSLFTRKDKRKVVDERFALYYGVQVKIKYGPHQGLIGKCVNFALSDVTVELDNIGEVHFNPTNLERIDD